MGPQEDETQQRIHHEKVGDKSHHYYRSELNHLLGPDGIISGFDLFSNGFMWYFTKGAAPLTSFLVSIAEYLKVLIANTKLLGNPNASGKEGEIAKQRRVGAMAWTQILAGIGGFAAFLNNITSKEEVENLSLPKKIGLSTSMLTSALGLFTIYTEKMLVIATSKGKRIGNEIAGIFLDAHNDLRAILEYLVMSVYPWVRKIKPIKMVIDLLVPVLAFRDGFGSFLTEGISKVFKNEANFKFPDKIRRFLKRIFYINGEFEDPIKNVNFPDIICNDLVIGQNGFRGLYAPVYRALGCRNFPEVKLKNGDGNKYLVIAA